MTEKRFLLAVAFVALVFGLSFSSGWAASGGGACSPADCNTVCEVMTAEECDKLCPPDCIAICDEVCAKPSVSKAAAADCTMGCGLGCCEEKSKASSSMAILDPSGLLSFNLAAGQSAEIMK